MIENGRWGPFIRFGKEMLKLSKSAATGEKYTQEELKELSFEEVKKLIEAQIPNAFEVKVKKKAASKTTTAKKSPAKKVPAKKAPVKKTATKK